MVTKQSKENEVYMKKTTLEEKLGYNQKGAKKELKMEPDRKSTRLNSSHNRESRMPSSA